MPYVKEWAVLEQNETLNDLGLPPIIDGMNVSYLDFRALYLF